MPKRNLPKTMKTMTSEDKFVRKFYEDKFARKFYCNSNRFVPDIKKRNRKRMRRELKREDGVARWQIQRLSQKLGEV